MRKLSLKFSASSCKSYTTILRGPYKCPPPPRPGGPSAEMLLYGSAHHASKTMQKISRLICNDVIDSMGRMMLFLRNKFRCLTKKRFENTRSIIKSLLRSRPLPGKLFTKFVHKDLDFVHKDILRGLHGKNAAVYLGKQVLMFDEKKNLKLYI